MKDTSFDQLKRFLSFFWETEIIGYIPQFLSFLQLCSYWKEIFWTLWKMFILCSSSIVVVVLCMLFFKNLVEFSWNIFIFSFISMTVNHQPNNQHSYLYSYQSRISCTAYEKGKSELMGTVLLCVTYIIKMSSTQWKK